MRKENWRSALIAYVDEKTLAPFAYGTNDCLLMVAGAVEAITGVDHAAKQRGRYTSLSGGKALLGGSLLKHVESLFPAIAPTQARDGDIAAKRQGREWVFGVIIGAQFYVQTETGIGIFPRCEAIKAFEVQ